MTTITGSQGSQDTTTLPKRFYCTTSSIRPIKLIRASDDAQVRPYMLEALNRRVVSKFVSTFLAVLSNSKKDAEAMYFVRVDIRHAPLNSSDSTQCPSCTIHID